MTNYYFLIFKLLNDFDRPLLILSIIAIFNFFGYKKNLTVATCIYLCTINNRTYWSNSHLLPSKYGPVNLHFCDKVLITINSSNEYVQSSKTIYLFKWHVYLLGLLILSPFTIILIIGDS